MKFILALILVTICMHMKAQSVGLAIKDPDTSGVWIFTDDTPWESRPDSIIYMSILDASRVEYWAQKGVTSVNLIAALEHEQENRTKEINFLEKVVSNCKDYQEEYRNKLEHVSLMYSDKQADYIRLETTSRQWEKKAKTRGAALWTVGGATLVLLIGIAAGL